mgnify:CR=1 FL=1
MATLIAPPGPWLVIPQWSFCCNYDGFLPGRVYGYAVSAFVMKHGHENCNCMRSLHSEKVTLFMRHPPGVEFPVHFVISSGWIAYATQNGFACNIPGFIVAAPETSSYGYLSRQINTDRYGMVYSNDV